jgi:hypothetical protein
MARSIQEIHEKFKRLLKDDALFYGLIMVLVALSSFGLGRWSEGEVPEGKENMASIVMSEREILPPEPSLPTAEVDKTEPIVEKKTGAYVASRKGTKYHLPTCPGASQIKPENKVYFDSKEEAEAAGYSPASNCKGL